MKLSKVIIILGRPGSGKGTQAKLLAEKFNLMNIDVGTELRKLAKRDNFFSKKLRETLAKGILVPLWLVTYCVLKKLFEIPLRKGIITEGIPRELAQAKFLEEALSWFGRRELLVIHLLTNEQEVTKRLLNRRICQKCTKEISLILHKNYKKCPVCDGKIIRRLDDYPSAIKKRMFVFKQEVMPVINYFKRKKLLIEINGEGEIQKIHQQIVKALKN